MLLVIQSMVPLPYEMARLSQGDSRDVRENRERDTAWIDMPIVDVKIANAVRTTADVQGEREREKTPDGPPLL